MERSKSVTIKEVAEKSGVSISTVSRVLNGTSQVSEDLRRRVYQAKEELGYVKNGFAASMKTGQTRMIVTVIPDLINDFFSEVVQGAEEVLSANGYQTLIFTTKDKEEKEKMFYERAFGRMIDGAIVIPSINDPNYYSKLSAPIVLADRTLGSFDAVVINNYKGGYLATKELIEAGHTKIAILNGSKVMDFSVCSSRYDGYLAALLENNITQNPLYVEFGDWSSESGYAMTEKLMKLQEPPTALFATNSQIGIGCLRYLEDKKITVGEDISLVVHDDFLRAQINNPPITVIKRPTREIGRLAAESLINILNHSVEIGRQKYVLDVSLEKRKSVKYINK